MGSERRFHPLVADDLSAATSYYDGISSDRGNRFRSAIRARFETISLRPESFGCIYAAYRAAVVERFLHVMMFENRDDLVLYSVSSKLHQIVVVGSIDHFNQSARGSRNKKGMPEGIPMCSV